MNGQFWISRKEIASLTGLSYIVIARNEEGLGLSLLRVSINRRTILYPRRETLNQLRSKFPWLQL